MNNTDTDTDTFGAFIAIIILVAFLMFMGGAIDNLWIKDKPIITVTYIFSQGDCIETNLPNYYLCEVKDVDSSVNNNVDN